MNKKIDILNIEPTKIDKSLKGKYICLYSLPKVGKTTFATSFPKHLLLSFERGYNAIAGAKPVDINKWSDFKQVLKQLESEQAQQMYDTIGIDTVGEMWTMCVDYICAANNVSALSDIAWGQGYTDARKEFSNSLKKITMLGYGIVIIAHSEMKTEQTATGEIEVLSPAIPKKAYDIVNRLVDIIGYIHTEWKEDGTSERILITRSTPRVLAGSRFPYLKNKIEFGYEQLTEALNEAIEKHQDNGAQVEDKEREIVKIKTFEEIREEAINLWKKIIEIDEKQSEKILNIAEELCGYPVKLSEITNKQTEIFEEIVEEMKAIYKELKV